MAPLFDRFCGFAAFVPKTPFRETAALTKPVEKPAACPSAGVSIALTKR